MHPGITLPRVVVCFALALAATLHAPRAQIVVDPSGSGQFTSLQAALDAAPAGAVIHVVGGTWSAIRIAQSVTLLAQPRATIAAPDQVGGGAPQPAAVTIAAGGADAVTLSGFDLGGIARFPTIGIPGPGIEAGGLRELRVLHCNVNGHQYTGLLTGLTEGAPGLRVTTGAPLVLIADSVVQGSNADTDGSPIWGLAGPAAIDAAGATVLALDSTLRGGDGSDTALPFPPQATLCPCGSGTVLPGQGGDGVIAARYFEADSTVTAGSGGAVSVLGQPWGTQPDGVDVRAGERNTLGFPLTATGPVRLGGTWSLQFAQLGPSVLVVGALAAPTAMFAGPSAAGNWLCLDPASIAVTIPLAPSATTFVSAVPNTAALAGVDLTAQVATLALAQLYVSRPVSDAVSF